MFPSFTTYGEASFPEVEKGFCYKPETYFAYVNNASPSVVKLWQNMRATKVSENMFPHFARLNDSEYANELHSDSDMNKLENPTFPNRKPAWVTASRHLDSLI